MEEGAIAAEADLGDAIHGGGLFDGAVRGVYPGRGWPEDGYCGGRVHAQVVLRRQLQNILSSIGSCLVSFLVASSFGIASMQQSGLAKREGGTIEHISR